MVQKIVAYVDRAIAWILFSSQDPKKTSLTLKMAMFGAIPFVVGAFSTACGFGLVCLGVTEDQLKDIVQLITDLVYTVLSGIAIVGSIYGAFRKIILTYKGKNKVFDYYNV